MHHYKSNLRDIEFNLFEVFGSDRLLGSAPFADVDLATARDIVREVDRMAREDLAESFTTGDRFPPTYEAATRTVTMNPDFAKAFHRYMEAEWWRLAIPAGLGGTPVPATVRWALAELVLGSNPPIHLYSIGPSFASLLWINGTPRDKAIAQHMVDRGWASTMVLTEPDAGSDVGSGRARASLQPDGSWHIEGVKRFITSGEHDLTDNIVHLVLARPVGVAGAGGPGTKGLSLFIVPKLDFDLATGELTGRHNGVYATALEHKMGIKASTTCELTFGAEEPAVGWLLGDVHNGIAQMFQIIENARMLVGTKAMATLSTGYLNALDYAKTRIQGPELASAADKAAPRVPIIRHPDVRRSLLTQKSYAEALRALVMFAASFQDSVTVAAERGETDDDAAACNDLLLPIVKGYGSERAWGVLGAETLQTFGGAGFLEDYPIEQYVRDAKIDTLYEGTTAIQGMDLFFRKIVRNQGRALGLLMVQMQDFLGAEPGSGSLTAECALLATALDDAGAVVGSMVANLMASDPAAVDGDSDNIYKVGLNTSRLLMTLGDVLASYLLLRQADIALTALAGEVSAADRLFYEGKVASAQFFARTVLPRVSAERAVAEGTDLSPMILDEAAF